MMQKPDVPDKLEPLTDIRRGFKFSVTSVIGLGVETVLLIALVELLSAPLLAAKVIGAEASIAAMFILNNRYTYDGDPGKVITRFLKSNVVRAGGIVIGIVVLEAGVSYGIWYPVANILGVCVGFVFNYGLETLFTWKEYQS